MPCSRPAPSARRRRRQRTASPSTSPAAATSPPSRCSPPAPTLRDDDGDGARRPRPTPAAPDPTDGDETDAPVGRHPTPTPTVPTIPEVAAGPDDERDRPDPGRPGDETATATSPADERRPVRRRKGDDARTRATAARRAARTSSTAIRRRRGRRPRAARGARRSAAPTARPPTRTPRSRITDFGAAPIGVPNFVIDQFSIPPFLLPIYQACGTQYGIPWEVLASINRIETAFGTNLNVSTAGALGWMQFIPSSWEMYGTDANGDGRKDPYNPVDAICAAARYLKAAGGRGGSLPGDLRLQPRRLVRRRGPALRQAVRQPAQRHRRLADRPDRGRPLPGRRQGALRRRHLRARRRLKRATPKKGVSGNAADVISDSPTRRGIDIFAAEDAPVVAVNDGVITKIGKNKKLGKLHRPARRLRQRVHLRRPRIESATWSRCRRSASSAPKDFHLVTPGEGDDEARRSTPATPTPRPAAEAELRGQTATAQGRSKDSARGLRGDRGRRPARSNTEDVRERLYALPERPKPTSTAPSLTGQLDDAARQGRARIRDLQVLLLRRPPLRRQERWTLNLYVRVRSVVAGTVLGRIGVPTTAVAPHVNFSISPAGRGATHDRPEADPRRLEAARGDRDLPRRRQEPVRRRRHRSARSCSPRSRSSSARSSPTRCIEIYSCGREDIATGQIDRRDHGDARVPGHARLPPDAHLAQVRPQRHDHLRQRQRPLDRRRGRHRPGQRHPDPRQPGPRLDHRGRDPGAAEAAGHDGARPGHLADGDGRPDLRDVRPRRPHPRRLHAGRRRRRRGQPLQPAMLAPEPVGQAARPDRRARLSRRSRPKPSKYSLPAEEAAGPATRTSASSAERPSPWHRSSPSPNSTCPARSGPATAAT